MTLTRRVRWVGLVLLLVVSAGGLWRWQAGQAADRVELATATAPASTPSAHVAWHAPRLGVPGAPASDASGQVGAPAVAGSQVVAVSIEVCGVGRVGQAEVDSWDPTQAEPAWVKAMNLRKDAALNALAARLAVGTDAERVAGRVLMGDTEGAALIGAQSTDATAYGLALARCRGWQGDQSASNCRSLSTPKWAQLDPDDARPWIHLAGEAMVRRDEAAAAQALEQALQRRKRSASAPLITLAARAREGVRDEAGFGQAMIQVIGVDASFTSSELAVGRYCSAEGVKDPARRSRCERLARFQFEHADTLMDAMLASGIADRVGLAADQRPYTRAQLDQALRSVGEQTSDALGFDCASMKRTGQWVVERARRGELRMALSAAGIAR